MKQRLTLLIVLLLFLSTNIIIFTSMNTASSGENKEADSILFVGGAGPNNYTIIQDAVDNATEGDTIFVYAGTYYEDVQINKTINIIGENRNTTIINGGWYREGLLFAADRINITELTIINTTHAILFLNSNHSKIINCSILNNNYGIMLNYSSYNQISDCYIFYNKLFGIDIKLHSDYNSITKCLFSYNGVAIALYDCSENNISYCKIGSDSGYGFHILNASNNNIQNCTLKGFGKAIEFLGNSDSNLVTDCEIINNYYGIIINNSESNLNTFHHNSFINNQIHAYDISENFWDNGNEGNYWDDYNGTDSNHDGIGDTSYHIPGGPNSDQYPLIIQAENGGEINNNTNITPTPPIISISTEQMVILLILIILFFVIIFFVLKRKKKGRMVKKHE